jgi:endonuclease/exonuclease/phosphatase (EEP) superfamily protein YafD
LSDTLRARLTVLAVTALSFAVLTMIVRARPLANILVLVVAVGSPYVPWVALSGLTLATLCRRILLSIVAVAVVAATVAVQVSWYYVGRPIAVGHHADIRVLSANLRRGQADASSFVELAVERADVVTVSELTPDEIQRFSQAGIEKAFPHSLLIPAPGAGGIGLWSRFPLGAVVPNAGIAAARLRVPGVRFDPLVASVHVTSPVAAADAHSFDKWRRGITAAKVRLAAFAATAGQAAVIAAGDYNSTPDMREFRDLLTDGYRDAVHQTGAGFLSTFPSAAWYPPLLTIDHVLTRHAAVSSIGTVDIRGSDHRALLATIQVPLNPTAS